MEEVVKGLLKDVLDLDEETMDSIGPDSDLLEVGLDSLKAIELVVYIEDNYDILISDDDLLIENMSSIKKIIEMIDQYQ